MNRNRRWLISQAFNTTPELWINLQASHDLAKRRPAGTIAPMRKLPAS